MHVGEIEQTKGLVFRRRLVIGEMRRSEDKPPFLPGLHMICVCGEAHGGGESLRRSSHLASKTKKTNLASFALLPQIA